MKGILKLLVLILLVSSCGYPRVACDPFFGDEQILSRLIETYGDRLDKAYNSSQKPEERGNWVSDVASEMDWERLVIYIINLPDFQDCEWSELYDLTDGRVTEVN